MIKIFMILTQSDPNKVFIRREAPFSTGSRNAMPGSQLRFCARLRDECPRTGLAATARVWFSRAAPTTSDAYLYPMECCPLSHTLPTPFTLLNSLFSPQNKKKLLQLRGAG